MCCDVIIQDFKRCKLTFLFFILQYSVFALKRCWYKK